jgi:hypothetical protein
MSIATLPHGDLRQIPGVGPRFVQVFEDLGILTVEELQNAHPERLYDDLCRLREGEYVDRCVLYVFRCAVYYATEAEPDPDRLLWWNWKDPGS